MSIPYISHYTTETLLNWKVDRFGFFVWWHINLVEVLLYIVKKLATIVEGDPKAPFSIATTPRCRGGRYSIPRIAPLYPWTVPYNAEC